MRVADSVLKAALPYKDKKIVVGLSGGADSVCLTHALKTAGFDVSAAHINHCLRGLESDRDEEFVRRFCESLDIELFVLKADVKALAMEHGVGLEAEGRRVRYEFFRSVPYEDKIIATAHNKNDAAETVLLHLIRGSGGIKAIPDRDGIIRPLLCVTRTEIEEYCRENNLDFCVDSTNLTEEYTRNKVRMRILPELRRINPEIEDALLRAAEISESDIAVVEKIAEKVPYEKVGDRLFVKNAELEVGVLHRLIRRLFTICNGSDKNLSFASVKSAAELVRSGKTGKLSPLYGKIFLETTYGGFYIGEKPEIMPFDRPIGEYTIFPECGMWVSARVSDNPGGKLIIDGDKVSQIYGRNRMDGDVISVNGHRKKLKSILIDKKIPKDERSKVIVLTDGVSVLGAIGLGVNREFKTNDKTVKFIVVDWGDYDEQ